MPQSFEILRRIALLVRQGAGRRRPLPAAHPTAGTNSPSPIVYNCSTGARTGSPATGGLDLKKPRTRGRAHGAVAKVRSSGLDAETEPKIPPWALIMAK